MNEAVFYVYENWTHKKANVHRASCSFCNDGHGMLTAGGNSPNGRWLGPFPSREVANIAARNAAAEHRTGDSWKYVDALHQALVGP